MDVKVEHSQTVNVGDIIEYSGEGRRDGNREHPFYLVSHAKNEGFFVISLTGKKDKIRFYGTIGGLMAHQKNIVKIYSQKEWTLKIAKIGDE
jgi:hypothetical protein